MTRWAFVRGLWLQVGVSKMAPSGGAAIGYQTGSPQFVGEDAKYTTYAAGSSIRFADMETVQVVDSSTLRLKFEPIPQQSLLLHRGGLVQTGNIDFTTRENIVKLRIEMSPSGPPESFVAWYRF